MKAYLITTGLIFALIAAAHIWRAFAEHGPVLVWIPLILLPAALCIWAFTLAGKSFRS
jgi:hypothetical protein